MRKCKECNKKFAGRPDKLFCSVKCKSKYHYNEKELIFIATSNIDKILHRNYVILKDLLGEKKQKVKIPELKLSQRKFNFNYITNYRINKAGKIYNYVYDFAWMSFSDNEVMIVRQRRIK